MRASLLPPGKAYKIKDRNEAVNAMEKDTMHTQTYQDFLDWPAKEKPELIGGVIYAQAAPSATHQAIVLELAAGLHAFLKGKPCTPFVSPFEVRLFADAKTVVQPDILVVCDAAKKKDWGCNGAPDFVVEVLSPSSSRMDRVTKRRLYRQAGVREYWIIDPAERTLETLQLAEGGYLSSIYEHIPQEKARVYSSAIEGYSIELDAIFR